MAQRNAPTDSPFIDILVVNEDGSIEFVSNIEQSDSLKTIQRIVEGFVEVVPCQAIPELSKSNVTIYVNEDGKELELEPNKLFGNLVGKVVLVGEGEDCEELPVSAVKDTLPTRFADLIK